MILESQVVGKQKCVFDFYEDEESAYLVFYDNKKLVFSWEIFEGFRREYSYNFYHDPDRDSDYLIKILKKFPEVVKQIRLFIIDHNIKKDEGIKYFEREYSNDVYEWLMKDYELWR